MAGAAEGTSRSGSIGAIGFPLKPLPRRRIPARAPAPPLGRASGALRYARDGVRVQRHLLGHTLVGVAVDVTQAVDDE